MSVLKSLLLIAGIIIFAGGSHVVFIKQLRGGSPAPIKKIEDLEFKKAFPVRYSQKSYSFLFPAIILFYLFLTECFIFLSIVLEIGFINIEFDVIIILAIAVTLFLLSRIVKKYRNPTTKEGRLIMLISDEGIDIPSMKHYFWTDILGVDTRMDIQQRQQYLVLRVKDEEKKNGVREIVPKVIMTHYSPSYLKNVILWYHEQYLKSTAAAIDSTLSQPDQK